MSEHTPGPWDCHDSNDVMAGDWDKHVATAWNNDRVEPDESAANARLIAAAPDLLEACRRMVEALSIHHMGGHEPFSGDQRYADAHQGLYDAIDLAIKGTS